MTPAPAWIRTAAELEELAQRLRESGEIALDTEGDSLHHYPERLALVQIADRREDAWLIDPLAIGDLTALGQVVAGDRPLIVLHAGDNDLAQLKRRYRFTFRSVFDTSVAARFLGARALGLDVLLREYLEVELPPSRQKDDWSVRPLSEAQERYAVADVQHLLVLKDRLIEHLKQLGRLDWVVEECAALAAEPVSERPQDPEAFAWLKGARELTPPELAILRALWEMREAAAREADRPPFKILADPTLVALARAAPASVAELANIAGCTPRVIGRWGRAILEAVARGRALPAEAWPVLSRPPRPPSLPMAVRRRIEALREWRATIAPQFGLDPGVLLPNRLIRPIAEAAPRDPSALRRVEGVRRWREEVLGAQIVALLARA